MMQFVYLMPGLEVEPKLQKMNVKLLTSLISVFLLCPLIYLLFSVIGLSLDTFVYLWNNLFIGLFIKHTLPFITYSFFFL